MSMSSSLQSALRRSVAVALVTGSSLVVAGAQTPAAQQSAGTTQPVSFTTSSVPQLGISSSALFSSSSDSASASSSSLEEAGTAAATTNLASLEKNFGFPGANAQYGRRRYGAPRYRGSNTNADGSEKYTFYAGAGFTVPVSTTSDYLNTSYGIQAGFGRNFNKHFGVNLEFDYDRFGLTGSAISEYLYVNTGSTDNSYGIDANAHVWNFSIQPVYQIYSGEGLGAYITGGVGFYHKVTNFTAPTEAEECYYVCEDYIENATFDHYTSNAPGFDGGFGLTYKFSHFSSERLYAEVRYVYMDNAFRAGVTNDNYTTYTGYNYFPDNSLHTSYFPVKFGVRF